MDVSNKHMLTIFYSGLEIKLKHTWRCSKFAYAYKKKRVNAFTIDTDEYYPVCYQVNDAKTFKHVVHYFMLANHHVYYRLARLTGAFKIIAIDF